jgi:hypothetical protein
VPEVQAQPSEWWWPPSAVVQLQPWERSGLPCPEPRFAPGGLPGPEHCLWLGWAWRRQRCLEFEQSLLQEPGPGPLQLLPLEQQPG